MKFFVDTADVAEIKDLCKTGLVDGVTTNPSLMAQSGRPFKDVLQEICSCVSGPVSAEVTAQDLPTMVKEGECLASLAKNIVIKVPLTVHGVAACKVLSEKGHRVNVTLCFSATQALLAAKAGAKFVSPFVGRLDDIGQSGLGLLQDIMKIYSHYPHFKTDILAASLRHPMHVLEAARIGVPAATMPPKVIYQLYRNPLTDKGLEAFLEDWRATEQNILG